mgnify:FL=1
MPHIRPSLLVVLLMWMFGVASSLIPFVGPLCATWVVVRFFTNFNQTFVVKDIVLLIYGPLVLGSVLGTAWLIGLGTSGAVAWAGLLTVVFWVVYLWLKPTTTTPQQIQV